jgi:hypothetical protein
MGPIDPIRAVRLVRRQPRPEDAERDEAPAADVAAAQAPRAPARPYRPPTNLDAHLIAQDNRRRGLRGGQPVLDAARSAYLETEYSGPHDRRHHAGKIARTDV